MLWCSPSHRPRKWFSATNDVTNVQNELQARCVPSPRNRCPASNEFWGYTALPSLKKLLPVNQCIQNRAASFAALFVRLYLACDCIKRSVAGRT
jgi:hypothetical protein